MLQQLHGLPPIVQSQDAFSLYPMALGEFVDANGEAAWRLVMEFLYVKRTGIVWRVRAGTMMAGMMELSGG